MSESHFEVQRVVGLATFQDLGTPGRMHAAVPPGGALVPELLVAANRAVDNADDVPCIEVQGKLTIGSAHDIAYAIDDRPAALWRAGSAIDVASGPRRCGYLAVRGGFLGVLGTSFAGKRWRGALLCAGDDPLRAGEVFPAGDRPVMQAAREPFRDGDVIRVVPGPDLDAFADDALSTLTSAPYRILPASNRVGTRLAGPALPRRADHRERTRPMVQGALEVPRDGQPIALGPEHPTTGGYPLLAVIASADVGHFHAIRLGGSVRFVVA